MGKSIKKIDAVNTFGNAQENLYNYVDWLYNTNRLTREEHEKLVNAVVDCVMKALLFEHK